MTDYRYNCLNQLVQKSYCGHTIKYSYDKRGNRISEVEKQFSQSYYYDETNRMVSGTNYNGDTSRYVYNGLGVRVQNTVLNRCRTVYNQYYVVDYTSPERNDLFSVTAAGCRMQYFQKYAYAGGEQIELSSYGPCRYNLLYVHEDEQGSVATTPSPTAASTPVRSMTIGAFPRSRAGCAAGIRGTTSTPTTPATATMSFWACTLPTPGSTMPPTAPGWPETRPRTA